MANTPQSGIFNESYKHTYFLTFQIQQYTGLVAAIKQGIAPIKDTTLVIAFGRQAWSLLNKNNAIASLPASLVDFTTLQGQNGHVAPGTQSDLFFWLQGQEFGDVFDLAMQLQQKLSPFAQLTFEQPGFDYHNSMDLIGFEDGTANPKTDELKRAAAVIPDGQPGAGGSLVMCQKWVHNLDAWRQVPVHCQEKIVGRTKQTNEELQGDAMPNDSHVSRTDLKVDGVAMKIYRRSSPFGNLHENGLMFLAFSCDLQRFTTQLNSMYGLADGVTDQLLNYSTAVSGGYWFAPSQELLATLLEN